MMNKKKSHTLIIFLTVIICVLLTSYPSIASTSVQLYNSRQVGRGLQGSILYVGGDQPGCYNSIQSAINDAKNGDTIYVFARSTPYYERITVDKSLTVHGEDNSLPIIDGDNQGTIVHIASDNVNFSGFVIQNSGLEEDSTGILINSDNNYIFNNVFSNNLIGARFEYAHNCYFYDNSIDAQLDKGIVLLDSSDIGIYENTVNNNLVGIYLSKNANYNTLYANSLLNNQKGIYIEESFFNSVYWNIITNAEYGIYIAKSSSNQIYDENLIDENVFGIYLIDSFLNRIHDGNMISQNQKGITLLRSHSNTISQNDIRNNNEGINIDNSNQNDVYWNEIENNIYGILIYASNNNEIYLNNILNSIQYGLYLDGAEKIKITYNNFINNYLSATFIQSSFSFNRWKKNYWDNWDGNGMHRISGSFHDFPFGESWYNIDLDPANNPYDI